MDQRTGVLSIGEDTNSVCAIFVHLYVATNFPRARRHRAYAGSEVGFLSIDITCLIVGATVAGGGFNLGVVKYNKDIISLIISLPFDPPRVPP